MNIFLIIAIALSLITVPIVEGVFAQVGPGGGLSGGGGGCSDDCTPPTLGITDNGLRAIEDGITINGAKFDVMQFSQHIPTKVINGTNHITIRIFENSGIENLQHVEFGISPYEQLISGVTVEKNINTVVWDKDNPNPDVTITTINEFTVDVTFSFDSSELTENVIKIRVWDFNRNSWDNYFTFESDLYIPFVDPRQVSEQAAILAESKDNAGAIALVENFIEKNPDHLKINLDLVILYFNQGEYNKALHITEEILQIDPTYPLALGIAAILQAELGYDVKAKETAKLLLEIDPDSKFALTVEPILLHKNGDYEQALDRINRILEQEPDFPHGVLTKARILISIGETDDAKKLLEDNNKQNHNESETEIDLGIIFYQLQEYEKALAIFDKISYTNPDSDTAKIFQAKALIGLGNYAKAELIVDEILGKNPNHQEALLLKGDISKSQGLTEIALSYYKKALKVNPDNQIAQNKINAISLERVEESIDYVFILTVFGIVVGVIGVIISIYNRTSPPKIHH